MTESIDYIALLIQFSVAMAFVVVTLVATHFLGPNRKTEDKLEIFESGIESIGNARLPFSIKYFLAAILFVMFDVEVIFMYPWAVNLKELGTVGFVGMFIFLAIFLLGFLYELKKGALKWE
ncbi:MAG: NADH-quinone oxidoreductase subunit A [Cyclobacteriaceae bacterium]|nr:NADH-quinone oxidoreductase subunit A [Cyclobacteriaceae bacterium]MCH8515251.1 NADH-quinone oxidoreductase subunit A [Cyclobacteriaceae bacterium]